MPSVPEVPHRPKPVLDEAPPLPPELTANPLLKRQLAVAGVLSSGFLPIVVLGPLGFLMIGIGLLPFAAIAIPALAIAVTSIPVYIGLRACRVRRIRAGSIVVVGSAVANGLLWWIAHWGALALSSPRGIESAFTHLFLSHLILAALLIWFDDRPSRAPSS